MTDDTLALAEDFDPATLEEWQVRAMRALGEGGALDRLDSQTDDGVAIRALYTRADLPEPEALAGFPGYADFLRGGAPRRDGWQMRQLCDLTDPAEANARMLRDLEAGAGGVILAVERPGAPGCRIDSADDLARALDGIDMTLAPVHLEAGARGGEMAEMLWAVWQQAGLPERNALGGLGLDPLGALARGESEVESCAVALSQAAATAADIDVDYPNVSACAISTRPYHDSGAGEAMELAVMLASAAAYLRAMEEAGLTPDRAVRHLPVTLMAEPDVLLTIAKFRAARLLLSRLLRACGIDSPRPPEITAETAPRMMARYDAWTNVLRVTVACFAAVAGGAEAVTTRSHDSAGGAAASKIGARIARNVQSILAGESRIGQVMDPAGGSFAMERLTFDLADAAWTLLQKIEGQGGLPAVLQDGWLAEEIDRTRAARAADIARRKRQVTGVSDFPDLSEESPVPPAAERDDAATEGALPSAGTLAAPFERLRDRARAMTPPPQVFLAHLGRLADYTARSTWTRNFLAAGGIAAVAGDGGTDIADIAGAWRDSGCPEAVICGPDALYADHAAALAQALKKAGAAHVSLAGAPGENEAGLRAAGIDAFIHRGVDAVAWLETALNRLGDDQ